MTMTHTYTTHKSTRATSFKACRQEHRSDRQFIFGIQQRLTIHLKVPTNINAKLFFFLPFIHTFWYIPPIFELTENLQKSRSIFGVQIAEFSHFLLIVVFKLLKNFIKLQILWSGHDFCVLFSITFRDQNVASLTALPFLQAEQQENLPFSKTFVTSKRGQLR